MPYQTPFGPREVIDPAIIIGEVAKYLSDEGHHIAATPEKYTQASEGAALILEAFGIPASTTTATPFAETAKTPTVPNRSDRTLIDAIGYVSELDQEAADCGNPGHEARTRVILRELIAALAYTGGLTP